MRPSPLRGVFWEDRLNLDAKPAPAAVTDSSVSAKERFISSLVKVEEKEEEEGETCGSVFETC